MQRTPPFMAIALLVNGATDSIHHAKYDLKSLMYVAFYCATMLKGPNDSHRTKADFKAQSSIPMLELFDLHCLETSYAHMGHTKLGHMILFEDAIIQRMDSYFSLLFPGFRTLKDAVFPGKDFYTDSPINHDTMIGIFGDMLNNLPNEHRVATLMKQGVKCIHPSEFI